MFFYSLLNWTYNWKLSQWFIITIQIILLIGFVCFVFILILFILIKFNIIIKPTPSSDNYDKYYIEYELKKNLVESYLFLIIGFLIIIDFIFTWKNKNLEWYKYIPYFCGYIFSICMSITYFWPIKKRKNELINIQNEIKSR